MPKYGSAQQAPDPPWQPFNAPSPSYQLSERLPQSWRYVQNKRSVCGRLKWALGCQSAGLREGVLGECFAVFLSIGPKTALPPAVILRPMGLSSHKHKQAKDDADNRQQAERRNTTTAKDILYKCAFLQLYLLYAFGRLKWHSSFIGSCIPGESNHDLALLFELLECLLCHMDWFLFNLTDFPIFIFIMLYENILGNI